MDALRPLIAELVREELAVQREEDESARRLEALSIAQTAELVSVSKKVVYGAIARGELPASKIGSRFRVRRSDVDAWLDGTCVQSARRADSPRRSRSRARRYGKDVGLTRLVAPYEVKE